MRPILWPLEPVLDAHKLLIVDGLDMVSAVGEQNQAGMIAWLTETAQKMDMMVMAFACDLTAVGTFQWSDTEAKHTFPWLSLSEHHHYDQHDGGFRPLECEQICTWYSQMHLYLLQAMDRVDMVGHTELAAAHARWEPRCRECAQQAMRWRMRDHARRLGFACGTRSVGARSATSPRDGSEACARAPHAAFALPLAKLSHGIDYDYDGYVWTFAKGRPDAGETAHETALREVRDWPERK